jgi:hypothetical protein
MAVISIAVMWLAVGFVVAALFGATAHRTRRETDDDTLAERQGAEIRYWRKQPRRTAADSARKHTAKRHAA